MIGVLSVALTLPFITSAWELPSIPPRVPHIPHSIPEITPPPPPMLPERLGHPSAALSAILERSCERIASVAGSRLHVPEWCEEGDDAPPPPPPEAGAVVINEIMYNPADTDNNHEWIEVWNGTDEAIDLTDWEFTESGGDHGLALASGVIIIDAGGYFVIADDAAQFQIDYPEFSGVLFDSSFSLVNTGETVAVKDAGGGIVDEVMYDPADGADGTGESLQRTPEDTWEPAEPTPGAKNMIP